MKHSVPHVSRRTFLQGTAAAAVAATHRGADAQLTQPDAQLPQPAASQPYVLHFRQPAAKWPDSLPVGNGRLGACVFGQPHLDRLQLNEETVWDGEPNRDRDNPKAAAAIPRIREMLFAGRVSEAEALATSDVLSIPRRMPCYQTLGDLHLDFTPMGLAADTAVQNYRLALDLDTAIATTRFEHDGATFTREVFVSAPDQVIVVRLASSRPGGLSARFTLDRPHSFHTERVAADRLVMTGQALPVNDNPNLPVKEHQAGVRFHAEVRLLSQGKAAQLSQDDAHGLAVRDADAVTLLIDCATSYRYPAHAGKPAGVDADVLVGDPLAMQAAVQRNLDAASRRTHADLRARHIADHQRFFRRMHFDLGPDPNRDVPTDMRVKAIKAGGEDPHLSPIYLQFGRYLLIGSSRPGTLAANLQGIWNESVDPPWGSKYTVNINAQMNYWFAETANLSDCHLPLFDLLAQTGAQGQRTAQQLYRAGGTVVHHNTDLWGDAGPIDGLGGGVWAMGSNWLSLHLWTHYAFTGDTRFLQEQAYPTLRENVIFLLDYLVHDPQTGRLSSGPSCSPENAYNFTDGKAHNLCMNPTMDVAITRSVFARFLQAAQVLANAVAADAALHARVRAAYDQLAPYQVAPDGRLQEWQVDYPDHEPGHRHISHLFGLFPEDQITVETTPTLAAAARATLNARLANGGGSTGWSRSWILNCMARLGDGEACYSNLLQLFRQSTRPNLFDVCGLKENSPFQIDGNLGGPAGMLEMLVQSHGHTALQLAQGGRTQAQPSYKLRLLPALPKAWPQGSLQGVRVRGGDQVDLSWSEGRLQSATLRCGAAGPRLLVLPPGSGAVRVLSGRRMLPVQRSGDELRFTAPSGATVSLHFDAIAHS